MSNRIYNTEIIYNSNCNYQQSKYTQAIEVPLSTINIDITITNVSQPTETKLYYTDTAQITIFAYQQIDNASKQPIKWGNVVFYYVDDDDLTETKQEINSIPIPIDNQGNASVKFIPHNKGTIYVKYYGEPYHKTENEFVHDNLILHPRPTYIQFEDYSPYLVNEEETVTMNVEVIDKHTEEPIDYGLVTFMNYHAYNVESEASIEKIIGNPQYLIDGKASIRYSPIQLGTNDLFHNIELIRASYNYNKDEYGVQWKYYAMHDDYTAIAIRRDNQININIPQIQTDVNTYQALTITDGGLFEATESNALLCQCEISLSENTSVSDAIVHFVVQGIKKIYNGDEVTEEEVTFVYPSGDGSKARVKEVTTRNGQKYTCFETLIEHLPQGMYQIYAQVENPKTTYKGEEYILPVIDNNLTTPNTPITNSELLVKDGLYLKSNTSETFYLKVNAQSSPLILNLTNNRTVVTNKIVNKNDIKLTITGVTADDINVLTGKTCYFYIPNLNATYKGTIIYNNNTLYAQPNSNINITNIGNYDMYAYIKGGTYAYKNNNVTTTRQYTTTYSQTINIKIRDQLNIDLRLQTIKSTYPNNIKYIVDGTNLSDDTIDVDIYIDNIKIPELTAQLSKLSKTITGIVPILAPGSHTIKAVVNDANYNNIQQQKTFTITKGELKLELASNQPILTSATTDLLFHIQHKQDSELTNINTINFKITPTIQNTIPTGWVKIKPTQINKKLYELHGTGCLYIAGDWQAKITCDDNNYYINPNTTIDFTAANVTPTCVNINKTTSSFTNKVIYDQNINYITETVNDQDVTREEITYDMLPIQVLVISKLIKDENHDLTFVHITNTNGEYTINDPIGDNIEWQQYRKIEYKIIPQHTSLLNAFKNINNESQAKTAFESVFANHNCSESDIKLLYNNSKSYNFTTLFIGYNEVTETINLYEEEENGSGSD